MAVALTIVHDLADAELQAGADPAFDQYAALAVASLDLGRDAAGKGVLDLTPENARCIAAAMDQRGLALRGLSTPLFGDPVEAGEQVFLERHAARVDQALDLARLLRPRFIALRAAATERRRDLADAVEYVSSQRPWLIPLYREALGRITDAGFTASIENAGRNSILATPAEVQNFFTALAPAAAGLDFDPVNLWQAGTAPSVEVYQQFADCIDSLHVKGGLADRRSGTLCWRCGLADASWPVVDVIRAALSGPGCQAICLRAPQGHRKLGYDYTNLTARDIAFLRAQFPQLA
jgi:sugar phosphate isomerase/epimerase